MIRARFFPTCLAAAALLFGSELRGFRGITVLPFCPRPAFAVFRAWDLSAAGSAIFNLARRTRCYAPRCFGATAAGRLWSRGENCMARFNAGHPTAV